MFRSVWINLKPTRAQQANAKGDQSLTARLPRKVLSAIRAYSLACLSVALALMTGILLARFMFRAVACHSCCSRSPLLRDATEQDRASFALVLSSLAFNCFLTPLFTLFTSLPLNSPPTRYTSCLLCSVPGLVRFSVAFSEASGNPATNLRRESPFVESRRACWILRPISSSSVTRWRSSCIESRSRGTIWVACGKSYRKATN